MDTLPGEKIGYEILLDHGATLVMGKIVTNRNTIPTLDNVTLGEISEASSYRETLRLVMRC